MDYSNRKWVIITLADYAGEKEEDLNEMIYKSMQSSINTLRKTNDGTKAILKWDGDTPSCFDGMTTYTHSEILTELAKSEWTREE